MRDTEELRYELVESFSETAKRYGFSIAACAEDMELESLGIRRGSCIDKGRFEQMGNCRLNIKKDPGQRGTAAALSPSTSEPTIPARGDACTATRTTAIRPL